MVGTEEYLRLTIGLLLPWLMGYFCLAAIESKFNPGKTNTLRQIGYGLFIGYAGLQGMVLAQSKISGSVSFWPILACVALITTVGGLLFLKTRPRTAAHPAPEGRQVKPITTTLFWLFTGWAALHLLFVAVEILHRPVFPWDAWLNWIYRAKAWFYSAQVTPLDHPNDWLQSTGSALYNVVGNHYPTFSPVLALWSATALGYWSETLINLPVMLCGIALGLGLYGQCREFGLAKWLAALSAYLLLSVPLVGTHLALAGQADIWMAGFTGLGFVALLHGIIRDNRYQILLGLSMAAMGIATKLEGAVWFLAALLTLALARHLRIMLVLLALAVLTAALGWLLGVSYVELPLVGGVGLAEGRVHIPLLGSYDMKTYELWDDYWDNFFKSGTWHLLWTFVLISACSLWLLPASILRRAIAAFFGVILAAQLFIFKGTESGQWAEDWTAINRLPLHFTAPLIFCIVILASTLLHQNKACKPSILSVKASAIGLAITLAGTLVYLMLAHPGGDVRPHTFSAHDMWIVVGEGRLAGDIGLIERYENNIAILSSGPVQVDTDRLDLLELETQGANQKPAKFFWRNGNQPEDLHSIEIGNRGTHFINLDELPQWRGQVNELGLIFYSDDDKPAQFHRLNITAHSLPAQLKKLARDWGETALWSQKSAHWLPAGAQASTVPLPILMAGWVLATLLITAAIARATPGAYAGALLCAVFAWTLLDLRWSANSLVQVANTLQTYPLISAEYLHFGDDQATHDIVESARPKIEQPHHRTIIIGEDSSMRFQVLRAKYHALPAATYVHEGPAKAIPGAIADSLLLLKKRYTAPEHEAVTADDYARAIDANSGLKASPVWENPDGFLLEIAPKTNANKPGKQVAH